MPAYFDANATTPVDPRVAEIVHHYMTAEFGNAGSRTHAFGSAAAKAVERAREQVAAVVGLTRGRVVFTSGATESNNLAILGLEPMGLRTGRKHVVTTAIEHKAVAEPIQRLVDRGFSVDVVKPDQYGVVSASDVLDRVRDDTLLVSVMHVNNETGMVQPIRQIADGLSTRDTLFHVDAAQGFGKDLEALRNPNIDFISVSSHKIYGPKGCGALILNEKNQKKKTLTPLMVGGGQEVGLRPGTLPVLLIAGLGLAAELSLKENAIRAEKNREHLTQISRAAIDSGATINGDLQHSIGNVINISFEGVDSESAILLLQNEVAISNGAACSSASYSYSHVLEAMGLSRSRIESALRISWYHDSEVLDWAVVFGVMSSLV